MEAITGIRTKTRTQENTALNQKVSGGALAALAAPSALIGLWSVACLVSAMASAGGPLGLARAWFQAVTGF